MPGSWGGSQAHPLLPEELCVQTVLFPSEGIGWATGQLASDQSLLWFLRPPVPDFWEQPGSAQTRLQVEVLLRRTSSPRVQALSFASCWTRLSSVWRLQSSSRRCSSLDDKCHESEGLGGTPWSMERSSPGHPDTCRKWRTIRGNISHRLKV